MVAEYIAEPTLSVCSEVLSESHAQSSKMVSIGSRVSVVVPLYRGLEEHRLSIRIRTVNVDYTHCNDMLLLFYTYIMKIILEVTDNILKL